MNRLISRIFLGIIITQFVGINCYSSESIISGSLNLENGTLSYKLQIMRNSSSKETMLKAILNRITPCKSKISCKQYLSQKQDKSDAPWLNDRDLCIKFLNDICEEIKKSNWEKLPTFQFIMDLSNEMNNLYEIKLVNALKKYIPDTEMTFESIRDFAQVWPIEMHIELSQEFCQSISSFVKGIIENSDIKIYQESEDEFRVSSNFEDKYMMYVSMNVQDIIQIQQIKTELDCRHNNIIKHIFIPNYQIRKLDCIIDVLSAIKNKASYDFNSAWNSFVTKQQSDYPFLQRNILEYLLKKMQILRNILSTLEENGISSNILECRRITLDGFITDISLLLKK